MRATHRGSRTGASGILDGAEARGPNHDVAALSAVLHAELKDALSDEGDIDIEYRTKPVISLAFTEEEARAARGNMAWQEREIGTPTRWADLQDVLEIESRINPAALGGSRDRGEYEPAPAAADARVGAGGRAPRNDDPHGNGDGASERARPGDGRDAGRRRNRGEPGSACGRAVDRPDVGVARRGDSGRTAQGPDTPPLGARPSGSRVDLVVVTVRDVKTGRAAMDGNNGGEGPGSTRRRRRRRGRRS